jgi:hypothetical protein
MPIRGLPVRIALPADVDLKPGALIDVIYQASSNTL